jgi:hypothetical protein
MEAPKLRTTTRARATRQALERGYHVTEEGVVISPKGKRRKAQVGSRGYQQFSYVLKTKAGSVNTSIRVHQLVAYQKFGDAAMLEKVVTRHLDGNPANNHVDNIKIGSDLDNHLDKSPEVLALAGIRISRSNRALTDQQVCDLREDRSNGMKYKDLSKKYKLAKASCISIVHGNSYKDLPIF